MPSWLTWYRSLSWPKPQKKKSSCVLLCHGQPFLSFLSYSLSSLFYSVFCCMLSFSLFQQHTHTHTHLPGQSHTPHTHTSLGNHTQRDRPHVHTCLCVRTYARISPSV